LGVSGLALASLVAQGGAAAAAPPSGGGLSGPLDSGGYALTSYYGPRCLPIIHASTFHGGQDLGAADGAPLYAIADGKVVRAQAEASAGQWLVVEHNIGGRTVQASYSHMWDADKFVRVGQTVRRGQQIAEVGSSGVSTAPHLHLEIWLGAYGSGTRVDPLVWFRQNGIDLAAHATRVVPRQVPSSCTYYAVGTTKIHASASSGSPVGGTVPHHTQLASSPGTKSGSFLPVSASGVSGWAHANNVSPTKLGLPAGRLTTETALRDAPSGNVVTGLAAGTALDDVTALSGGWYQVRAGSRTGWVPRANVQLEPAAERGIDNGFFLANTFTTEADTVFDYGEEYDEFFVGDWDGDGVDTFAVRRGSVYHFKNSVSSGAADAVVPYGRAGDAVMVGDFDGDGGDTLAVRRGPEYHVKNSVAGGPADQVVVYGRAGDDVLVGDWDGDGDDTLAVRRGAEYHIKNTVSAGNADVRVVYGRPSDEVYVGDWNGDGKDSLGVYRF